MATKKKLTGYVINAELARGSNALRTIRQSVNYLAGEGRNAYAQAALLLKISTAAADAQDAINEIESIVRQARKE